MIIYLAFSVLFIWLIINSWILYKTRRHYYNLISLSKKESLDEILEQLLAHDKKFSAEIDNLIKHVNEVIKFSKIPLQKIGVVRFNPFGRGNSEQSYVIALLNHHNSGIIINFIHTKEGLRSYIKQVKHGKGDKYELTEEESESVKKSSYY